MRYEIVIDDENQEDPGAVADGTPWTATLFQIDDDGKSGDAVNAGIGTTPRDAVMDLFRELHRNPHVDVQAWNAVLEPEDAERAGLNAAYKAWLDAREGDSNDSEHAAAADLIEALMGFAGIDVDEDADEEEEDEL